MTTTSRPTVKSLQASLLVTIGQRDDLQSRLNSHNALLQDQRRRLVESQTEARGLRDRLDALASILSGAVQITHVPRAETAMSLMTGESPR